MVSHHCGLGTCSRKRGAVGLSTSLGSGLERIQIVVEWAREGHVALVCVRNKSTVETEGVLKAGGTVTHGFPAVSDKEEGGFSGEEGGENLEAQWLSSEKLQWLYPDHPQSLKKNLRTGKLRVRPKVSKRLSGDRWNDVIQHPSGPSTAPGTADLSSFSPGRSRGSGLF